MKPGKLTPAKGRPDGSTARPAKLTPRPQPPSPPKPKPQSGPGAN